MEPLSQKLIQMGGQAPTGYWITEVSGPIAIQSKQVVVDSTGNPVCLARSTNNTGSPVFGLTENGVINWQRYANVSGGGFNAIALGSGGTIHLAGETLVTGYVTSTYGTTNSSSGSIAGSYRHYSGIGTERPSALTGAVINSSSEVIACGYLTQDSYVSYNLIVRKIGLWERSLASNSRPDAGVVVDSLDNSVYVAGATGSSLDTPLLVKYDNSGTFQWSKTIGPGGGSEEFTGISGSGSGQRFLVGSTKSIRPGFDDILVCSYASDGTIAWQKALGGTSGNNTGAAITTENLNDTVVLGQWGSGILIAKYDANGVLQWQRLLTKQATTISPKNVVLSGANIYVIADIGSSGSIAVCKLRANGGGTGVFGDYTYAAGTASDVTTTLTGSNASISAFTLPGGGSGTDNKSFNTYSLTQPTLLIA